MEGAGADAVVHAIARSPDECEQEKAERWDANAKSRGGERQTATQEERKEKRRKRAAW